MQKITPFLWFNTQAEEAANFYVSVFENSKITMVSRYDDASAAASGMPKGSAMVVAFQLDGQQFSAINGGPVFQFTEAISFVIDCADQEEVDYYWEKLSSGGSEGQCGWLKDKFGLSWQVVPKQLGELLSKGNPNVMQAMLKMKKIDIKGLEDAAA